MSDLILTKEQEDIVFMKAFDNRHNGIAIIEAKAGTGKTSTILSYASEHRSIGRIAATTFSKTFSTNLFVRVAAAKLSGIVKVNTTHSVAYDWINNISSKRKKYKMNRLEYGRRDRWKFKVENGYSHGPDYAPLSEHFFEEMQGRDRRYAQGGRLREHHEAWHKSGFSSPEEYVAANGLTAKDLAFGIKSEDALAAAIQAADDNVFYDRSPQDVYIPNQLKLTHDAYLKAMQLSGYIPEGVSLFLHDEAQDSSECAAAWIKNLSREIPVIAVGDSCQQINGWNGAHNILQDLSSEAIAEYVLSRSFRCNRETTDIANAILAILGSPVLMVPRNDIPYPRHPTTAEIYRTRAGVLEAAIECYRKGIPYRILSSFNDALISKLINLEIWKHNGSRRTPSFIRDGYDIVSLYQQYGSYFSAKKYAREHEVDLSAMFRLVDKYGGDLGTRLKEAMNHQSPEHVPGLHFIGTVHASKGMEFDNVILGDDFIKEDQRISKLVRPSDDEIAMNLNSYVRKAWMNNPGALCVIDSEELRLKYTAATRARFNLTVPDGFVPDDRTTNEMARLREEGKLVFA